MYTQEDRRGAMPLNQADSVPHVRSTCTRLENGTAGEAVGDLEPWAFTAHATNTLRW